MAGCPRYYCDRRSCSRWRRGERSVASWQEALAVPVAWLAALGCIATTLVLLSGWVHHSSLMYWARLADEARDRCSYTNYSRPSGRGCTGPPARPWAANCASCSCSCREAEPKPSNAEAVT